MYVICIDRLQQAAVILYTPIFTDPKKDEAIYQQLHR
jgi:hypothetical protein